MTGNTAALSKESTHQDETTHGAMWRIGQDPLSLVYSISTGSSKWTGVTLQQHRRDINYIFTLLRDELGVGRGDVAILCLESGYWWEVLQRSFWLCGALVGAIDPGTSGQQLESVGEDVPVTWIVKATGEETDLTLTFSRKTGLPAEASFSLLVKLNWCVASEETITPQSLNSGGLHSKDFAALLTFTSGSTGKPKALVYSYEQVLLSAHAWARSYPTISNGDQTISWLPLANLFQRMVNLAAAVWGVHIYLLNDPSQIKPALIKVEPAFLIGVPRFFEKLASTDFDEELQLSLSSHLKAVVTGGAPLSSSVHKHLIALGIPLFEGYGLSENIVPIALNTPAFSKIGGVGRPLLEHQLFFNEMQEISVRSPGIHSFVFKDKEQLKPALDSLGFLKTGDIGFLDEEGCLHLTGRSDDLIKTSTGRRIAPQEIEESFCGSPLISELVIIGNGFPFLMGFLSTAAGNDQSQIEEFIMERNRSIRSYARVFGWIVSHKSLQELGLRTPTDKVRRKELALTYQQNFKDLSEHLLNLTKENRDSVILKTI